jgi:hypothetical protein
MFWFFLLLLLLLSWSNKTLEGLDKKAKHTQSKQKIAARALPTEQ